MSTRPFGVKTRNSPMMRQAIRGLVLLALLVAVVDSTVRAQNIPDKVEYRDRKDGSIKKAEGQLRVGPAGFQVFTGDKFDKASLTLSPDDILKVTIGDLQGVDRGAMNSLFAKEDKKTAKDCDEARTGYQDLLKKATGAPERTKRHLEFKIASMTQRVVDDLDPGEKWEKQADDAIKVWSGFMTEYKTGWELWPAAKSLSRLQVERGKFDDAAR